MVLGNIVDKSNLKPEEKKLFIDYCILLLQ